MLAVTRGTFTLVRHAMPSAVPDEDPSTWRLGPEGLAASRELSRVLPNTDRVVSSPEPKAVATAQLTTGREPQLDLRLVEVRRPSDWNTEHRSDVRRYLAGEELDGWEGHEDVLSRMTEAMTEHLTADPDGDLVVFTHGIGSTLWLERAVGIDAISWWSHLRYPDAWAVDLDAASVLRLPERTSAA